MKKSAVLAGSLVVAAAAYTGAAWYVGMEAENTIRAAVDRANQRIIKTLGPDVGSVGATLSIDAYQRGLFSSRARYTFTLQDGDDRTQVTFEDHMQHGPFPWGLVSQGVWAPQLAWSRSQLVDTESVKRWFDAARGAMPVQADTRIGFGGRGKSAWRFAPLEWVSDDEQLSFSGGQVDVEFSNDFRDSDAQGGFEQLTLGEGAGNTVVLRKIDVKSTTRTASDESVKVDSRVDIGAMVMDAGISDALVLEGVAVTLDSTQKGEQLDAALRYDVRQLRVGEASLGSITLGGQVNRFNFDAFSKLISEYDAIAAEHGVEDDEDFDLTPEDESRLLGRLVPLLASSPAVAVQPVAWRNEQGESTLALNITFQPLPAGDAKAQEEALPDSLKEMHLEIALSRPMLMQAVSQASGGGEDGNEFAMFAALIYDGYIAQLEQQGVVRIENDRALLSVRYENGEVNLNGETMPVEEFLNLISEMEL